MGVTQAFGYQYKGWVGILVSVVMRVQAESRGLGDEIELGWEYKGMKQLVEPKQEIKACGWYIVGLWAHYKISSERPETCLILLSVLCELLLFQATPRGTRDRSCSLIFVLEETFVWTLFIYLSLRTKLLVKSRQASLVAVFLQIRVVTKRDNYFA